MEILYNSTVSNPTAPSLTTIVFLSKKPTDTLWHLELGNAIVQAKEGLKYFIVIFK